MADKNHKILLVEDDLMLRKCLIKVLEKMGWESEGVATVEEAVERLSAKEFSLVITDYQLGTALNGLSLLSHMGRIGCRTPSILMTATKSEDLGDEAKGLGAFAFLNKPFGTKVFLDLCRKALFLETGRDVCFPENGLSESVL